jgi:hypothetical protein
MMKVRPVPVATPRRAEVPHTATLLAHKLSFKAVTVILTSLHLHTILLIPVYDKFKDQRIWSF